MTVESHGRLVSVVIPAFNEEAFIAAAIDSVLAQSYSPIECLVVDDGSTDATARVVDSFEGAVGLLHQANRGEPAARNAGIRASRGEFIAFLDADDLWHPDKLVRQIELLASRPQIAAAYCAVEIVDAELNHVGFLPVPKADAALRNTLLLEHPFVPGFGSTGVVRREVFEEVGLFDEHLRIGADREFICRVASRFPVEGIADPLVRYRRHGPDSYLDPEQTHFYLRLMFDKVFADSSRSSARLRNRAEAN